LIPPETTKLATAMVMHKHQYNGIFTTSYGTVRNDSDVHSTGNTLHTHYLVKFRKWTR